MDEMKIQEVVENPVIAEVRITLTKDGKIFVNGPLANKPLVNYLIDVAKEVNLKHDQRAAGNIVLPDPLFNGRN